MRGDETQLDSTGGGDPRERRGPRHAAPRKSLLTKWQMPAGKAMALAAMPTAVLVGMSLTPKLAMADDKTDIPFAPGPCVTRSDSPSGSPSPSGSASGKASPSPSASSKPDGSEPDGKASKPKTPTPTASGSASDTVDKLLKPAQPADKPSTADAPAKAAETPQPAKTTNPLDPLGLGDALKGLFGIHDTPSPQPTQSTSTAAPAPKPSASTAAPKPSTKASKPATTGTKPVDKTADAIKKAADEAGQKVAELPDAAKGLDPKKDTAIPDGAKPAFPCPTADPKALAAAKQDSGVPTLPTQPWILKSSKLTLSGLNYEGIVEVKAGDTTKKVLKFTASSVDIDNLDQQVYGPVVDGSPTTAHVVARSGSQSTIRNGTVTMYTEELKGNLFGLIPVTFSPATPPPLNVPFAIFTNVTVRQAGQFGGTLTVPGLHNYVTKGNPT
ncbi:hypothetical protein [Streptomyces violascens]|uniref:Hydrogenase expression protein HypF n=1 Tax=Streptomyces violascens TaxID=67381 RepID=A0ABQ3QZZ4_9ACTN|nr:hypothetical protein [Streptomyces violascens]GGU14648.1 hypothetical protein GCM10010289_40420 [Streptomyces violascens]GHI42854.1 hypothetical protein Sviol_72620 [Streptomyces violascens]